MQHSGTNITGMCRLMPAAAARKNRDLTAPVSGRQIGPDDNILTPQQSLTGAQIDQALQHLAHDGAGIVDELLHFRPSPFDLRCRRPEILPADRAAPIRADARKCLIRQTLRRRRCAESVDDPRLSVKSTLSSGT